MLSLLECKEWIGSDGLIEIQMGKGKEVILTKQQKECWLNEYGTSIFLSTLFKNRFGSNIIGFPLLCSFSYIGRSLKFPNM